MQISHNVVLITGGASGIGLELATQLLARNNIVIITGRDIGKLESARKKLPKLHIIQSDVSKPESIIQLYNEAMTHYPQLNILINNAGIMRKINMHDKEMDLHDISREIDTNLNGPIRMIKQFLPHLKTQKEAAIVNVTSGLAFVPLAVSPVYSATKAALHSFTQSLRLQMKHTHVKVFELAPPATQTDLLGSFEDDLKRSSIMPTHDMVKIALKAMEHDNYEIRPGQSNLLKGMSRIAPDFMVKQLGKSVDVMLSHDKYR